MSPLDAVHREAHAVHGDRALARDVARELGGRVAPPGARCRPGRRTRPRVAHAVHVARSRGGRRCGRQGAATSPGSPSRPASRPAVTSSVARDVSTSKASPRFATTRVAHALDRDGVADRRPRPGRSPAPRCEGAAPSPCGSGARDAAHGGDDPGEHQPSMRAVMRMSAPTLRTSTTRRCGAPGPGSVISAQREEALRRVAQEQRREVEHDLVDRRRAREERAHELAARLDRDLVEAALAQQARHRGEVGLAPFARHDAPLPRRAPRARVRRSASSAHREDERRLAREDLRRERQVEMMVDHHAPRLARARHVAHRELGIVGDARCRCP